MNLEVFRIPKSKKGIYFLLKNNEVVYVGQTVNIHHRINQHVLDGKKDFDSYNFIPSNKDCMLDDESFYIFKYKPIYNKSVDNFINLNTLTKKVNSYLGTRLSKKKISEISEKIGVKPNSLGGVDLYPSSVSYKISSFHIHDLASRGIFL